MKRLKRRFFGFLKTPFHGLSSSIWQDCVYLMNTHFCLFFGPGLIDYWVGQEVGWTFKNFFGLFKIFFSETFQLINTHFLVIFGPWFDFRVEQKLGGEGQNFLVLKHFTVELLCIFESICLINLVKKVK